MAALTCALKEWEIAVEALLQGELILLLRKGGIRETQGRFQVQSDNVALFPTLEHQQPECLKLPWRDRAITTTSPSQSDWVTFTGWAEITELIPLRDPTLVARLTPFHLWTEAWAMERLAWKPQQPLLALCLRAYRFPEPHRIDYQTHFGGCRSWLDLAPTLNAHANQR